MANPEDPKSVATAGPISRDDLYQLVWAKPMLKVAEQFGVSSSYMARVCTVMNVPRPERGHWARLAVGQRLSQPQLPEARPEDQLLWGRGIDLSAIPRAKPRYHPIAPSRPVKAPKTARGLHPLVASAKSHFEAGQPYRRLPYLKPDKWVVADLVVTKTGLERALSFANALFWRLDDAGYRVMIAPAHEHFHR